jgi:hypothetical protein
MRFGPSGIKTSEGLSSFKYLNGRIMEFLQRSMFFIDLRSTVLNCFETSCLRGSRRYCFLTSQSSELTNLQTREEIDGLNYLLRSMTLELLREFRLQISFTVHNHNTHEVPRRRTIRRGVGLTVLRPLQTNGQDLLQNSDVQEFPSANSVQILLEC